MELKNKLVVITGASQGLGRAIAWEFAVDSTDLILVARDKKKLESLEYEIKKRFSSVSVKVYAADVSKKEQLKEVFKKVRKDFKSRQLFGVVNNAGHSVPGLFQETSLNVHDESISVNYLGSLYMTQIFLPLIENGGFITFVSSVLGYMGVYGYSTYVPAKFALLGLAEVLKQELFEKKIYINVFCPADTDTPGYKIENKTKPYETAKLSEKAKLMRPEEVARKYIKNLKKKKYMIFANFESLIMYRLSHLMPVFKINILILMIKQIRRKRILQRK